MKRLAEQKFVNSRLVKKVPFHCEVIKIDGESVYTPRYAEIVARMFELRIQGKGAPSIAKILNEEFDAPKKLRKGEFSQHFVLRVLKDRATTGVLVMRDNTEVADYFPAAISDATYLQANDRKPFMTGVVTAKAGTTNVIKGTTRCNECHNGVIVKTSKSKFRYLKCVKSSHGCMVQRSLQYSKVLLPILDSLLDVHWITKALKDIKRSKERIDYHEKQVVKLNQILQKASNLTVIENLVERIEQHDVYITFFRTIESGNHETILDGLNVGTKSGRATLNLILNITFKKIIVDFSSEQITLVTKIDNHTQKRPASINDIRHANVWELQGLSSLLLKDDVEVSATKLRQLLTPPTQTK
ncbi:recombinase family protein [Vibrio superstes]|uniref:Recombinase domain-containing protein n=1 Tax=Vibrio superstes NBRC 103154 TaxID=1219062 RepID=A0A511QP55_9VIBR|nr:recombinase family protein [Vibrio superstes]GEM79113.1 hypothetical protein VSU01S_13580 [Vibrio superstes NBRC 103154]